MSELPEGVDSVMYLRDGWPDVVVCKVKMKTEHVGIGVFRARGVKFSPSSMDHLAFKDAMANMGLRAPDYTEVQEHVAKLKADNK
jgi:hypothetical protein